MENQNQQPQPQHPNLLRRAVGAALLATMPLSGAASADRAPVGKPVPTYTTHLPEAGVALSDGAQVEAAMPETALTVTTPTSVSTTESPMAAPTKIETLAATQNEKAPVLAGKSTEKGTEKPFTLNPERIAIPPNVLEIMKNDTVSLPGLNGCSGMLIYNAEGEAVGALTAVHCGLRATTDGTPAEYTAPRIRGNNGATYIVKAKPIVAYTGDSDKTSEPVGTIDKFILPASENAAADQDADQAIGVFAGHTTKEAMTAYLKEQLSAEEIAAMQVGETVYMSGWPQLQPENPGSLARESFAGQYIGSGEVPSTAEKKLHAVLIAIPEGEDGSICSFGASGSEGFIMQQQVQPDGGTTYVKRPVGDLAVFIDLTGTVVGTPESAAELKAEYEQEYSVDLTGMAAICGFSDLPATPANGGSDAVNVVRSTSDIPGYVDPSGPEIAPTPEQDALNYARQSFEDPNPKHRSWNVLDGLVSYTAQQGGDKGSGEIYVNRPLIFTFPDGSAVLGVYDNISPDNLDLSYFASSTIFNIYPENASTKISLVQAEGTLTTQPPVKGGGNLGSFVDSTGLQFGTDETNQTPPTSPPYEIMLINGDWQILPRNYPS